MAAGNAVLAVRYGHRVTSYAEMYLNYPLYGEPDADLDIAYYFWIIRDGSRVTLVDTGFAPEVGDRRRRALTATPVQALAALGIAPADVDVVVITHAHWDHIGNIGQFPHADLVLTEAEYAFWTSPMAARAHFAAHAETSELAELARAREQGRVTLFSGELTLAPGVELIEVGGHIPGSSSSSRRRRRPAPRCWPPTRCTSTPRPSAIARCDRRRPAGHVPGLRPAQRAGRPARHVSRGRPRPAGERAVRPAPGGPRRGRSRRPPLTRAPRVPG